VGRMFLTVIRLGVLIFVEIEILTLAHLYLAAVVFELPL